MIKFTTTILQFLDKGEKTGWTYITIPSKIAAQLKPGNKKSFRVKGLLDNCPISGVALIPMGEGNFIMALNAALRKKIRKNKGALLQVQIEEDENAPKLPDDFVTCLADEKKALEFFNTLAPSHRNYFGSWIKRAKTKATQAKRIGQAISALEKGFDFGSMVRSLKADKESRN